MTSATTGRVARTMLNKVPEVTIFFWIIKILATTVGETAADNLRDQPRSGVDRHDVGDERGARRRAVLPVPTATRAALHVAQRPIDAVVDERLRRAARFYVDLHGGDGPWDFGDSDDAVITPFAGEICRSAQEWRRLAASPRRRCCPPVLAGLDARSGGHGTGRGVARHRRVEPVPPSGYAVWRDRRWTLRWDVSPLGYLSTAAHGHQDALHLSLWLDGVAIVVDPGTGCYFVDPDLRTWLASALAHNGPAPVRPECLPRRRGPFLWEGPHPRPVLEGLGRATMPGHPGMPARHGRADDRAGAERFRLGGGRSGHRSSRRVHRALAIRARH